MNTPENTTTADDWMSKLLKKIGNNDEIKWFGFLSILTSFFYIGIFVFPYLVLITKKESISPELKRMSVYMLHLAVNWVALGIVVFFLQLILQIITHKLQLFFLTPLISSLHILYYIGTIVLFVWLNLTHIKGKVATLPKWIETLMVIKLNLPHMGETPATEKK